MGEADAFDDSVTVLADVDSVEPTATAVSTESEQPLAVDPLLGRCLAAFHTAFLATVAVALLHWSGALGDLLGGLSTTVGLVLYLLLWATTWWTNRRLLASVPFSLAATRPLLSGSLTWGGATGSLFFLELVAVAVGRAGLAGELGVPDAASVLPILFVLALGTVVGFLVGGLVGLLLVCVDLSVLYVVERLSPPSPSPPPV